MAKTYPKNIADFEFRYLSAVQLNSRLILDKLIHPDALLIDEFGDNFSKQDALLLVSAQNIHHIRTIENHKTYFGNTVIVTSLEDWSGRVAGVNYEHLFQLHRIWKNSGRKWQLVFSSRHDLSS